MKLKKILAGAMAGAMVLGSVVSVSAATYTSTGWWGSGGETVVGEEVYVASDYGQVTYTISATDESGNEDFGVEVYDANGRYISTFTGQGVWYYDATGDEIVESGLTGVYGGTILTESGPCTITVDRAGTDFTVTYALADGTVYASVYAANTDLSTDGFYTHFYLQYGAATASGKDTTDITASSDTMSVLVDGTKNLPTITTTPSAMKSVLTYTSSDESIATVSSDGVVTGVAAGTATITAAYGNYSTTIEVKVAEDEVALEGVTVSDSEVSVVAGATATITATPNPTDTTDSYSVTWASDDEDVATVEDGVITGVAAGTATVTVTYTTESGSYSAEVAVTVTESTTTATTTTAEDTDDTDTEDATTEEETETEETVTTVEESETMEITDFWATFTSGYEITEDVLTLTFTTTSTGSNYYNNAVWALYSSDSGYICTSGADSDAATADNYVEYWVGRADYYGWGVDTATYEVTSEPEDWDAWFAATQEGATVTVTAYLDGEGNAVISCACEGYEYTVTVPVDTSSSVYLTLSGEQCVLSDLTVNGESANFPVLVQTAVTEDTETTETETETESSTTTVTVSETQSGSSTGDADTGDASPIIPIAVAMLGCAAVVIAGKKRMA